MSIGERIIFAFVTTVVRTILAAFVLCQASSWNAWKTIPLPEFSFWQAFVFSVVASMFWTTDKPKEKP